MNKQGNSKIKVFVALSGGVDSAVSAAILKEMGFDVTGVYMKNWSGDDFGIQADCPWEVDQADAEAVCKHLGIPFRSFNFEKQYRDKVVEYFFSEFEAGRTPNPDVMCNKEIKFKLFLDKAIAEGADYIATGHYARKAKGLPGNTKLEILNPKNNYGIHAAQITPPAPSSHGIPLGQEGGIPSLEGGLGRVTYHLLTGNDDVKNQVYFLYNITQEQLARTIFPVGHMPKKEVRELAKKYNLPNQNKPDSQGICFIGEIDVLKFLMARIPEKKGDLIDVDTNKKVGEHKGVYFYTIGQRKGLEIGGAGSPYYVCKKDAKKNIVYVAHGSRHPALFSKEAVVESIHWIAGESESYANLAAVHRYQQKPQSGSLEGFRLEVSGESKDSPTSNLQPPTFIFDDLQRAITSGQSLVIFDGDECLGGGVIS